MFISYLTFVAMNSAGLFIVKKKAVRWIHIITTSHVISRCQEMNFTLLQENLSSAASYLWLRGLTLTATFTEAIL